MRYSDSQTVEQMTAIARVLPEFKTAAEVDRAAAGLVASVIDADETLLTRIDLRGIGTVVRSAPDLCHQVDLSEALSRVGHLHPAVLSYLDPGDDGSPRRVSDVISNRLWWSSAVFGEAFRERGAKYQLSLVTRLDSEVGTGWVLTRSDRDFSEHDVQTATLTLPFLIALTELAAAKVGRHDVGGQCLTQREHDVLEMLATGKSARQIARALGMTEATARKHLLHIYAKLGVHDRLSAVLCLNWHTCSGSPAADPHAVARP